MSTFNKENIDESSFEVRVLKGKNRCVFTNKFIKKGTTVLEYRGDLITSKDEIEKRETKYTKNKKGCFILEITLNGKKAFIDATRETKFKARLMSHSDNPNLIPFKTLVDGVPRVFFKAKFDIKPNSELVWDYGERRKAILESNPWLKPRRRSAVAHQNWKEAFVLLEKLDPEIEIQIKNLNRTEGSWLDGSIDSFKTSQINSNSTPLNGSMNLSQDRVLFDSSVQLKNARVVLENLSFSHTESNNTSAPHSGASELLDILGETWMNSSTDPNGFNENVFQSTRLSVSKDTSTCECDHEAAYSTSPRKLIQSETFIVNKDEVNEKHKLQISEEQNLSHGCRSAEELKRDLKVLLRNDDVSQLKNKSVKLNTHQSQEFENTNGDISINSVEQDFSHYNRCTEAPEKEKKILVSNDLESKFKNNYVEADTHLKKNINEDLILSIEKSYSHNSRDTVVPENEIEVLVKNDGHRHVKSELVKDQSLLSGQTQLENRNSVIQTVHQSPSHNSKFAVVTERQIGMLINNGVNNQIPPLLPEQIEIIHGDCIIHTIEKESSHFSKCCVVPVREVKVLINNDCNSKLKDKHLESCTHQSEHVNADSTIHPVKKSSLDSSLDEVPEIPIKILSSNDNNPFKNDLDKNIPQLLEQLKQINGNSLADSSEKISSTGCKSPMIPEKQEEFPINNNCNRELIYKHLENYTHQSEHINADLTIHPVKKSSLDSTLDKVPEIPIKILSSNDDNNPSKNDLDKNNPQLSEQLKQINGNSLADSSEKISSTGCKSPMIPEKQEEFPINNNCNSELIEKPLVTPTHLLHPVKELSLLDSRLISVPENQIEFLNIGDDNVKCNNQPVEVLTHLQEHFKHTEKVSNLDQFVDIANCEILFVDENSEQIVSDNFQGFINELDVDNFTQTGAATIISDGQAIGSVLNNNFGNTDLNPSRSTKPKIIESIIIKPNERKLLASTINDKSTLIEVNQLSNSEIYSQSSTVAEFEDIIEIPENEEDDDDEDDLCDKDYLPQDDEDESDEEEFDDEEEVLNKSSESTLNSTQDSTAQKSQPNTSFSYLCALSKKSAVPAESMQVPPSLGKSGKSKQHFCCFCNTLQLQIARHLRRCHKEEPAVKNFMSMKKNTNEKRKAIGVLRKKGDFIYNTSEDHNKGFLITVRRPQLKLKKTAEEFVNCPKCYGFYTRNNIRHHYAECTQSNSSNARCILQNAARQIGRVHQDASYKMRHKILPVLQKDDITNIIRYDRLIILFGNLLSVKYKKPQQDNMIRSQLRLLARFVLALKQIVPEIDDLAAAFHPSFFNNVLEAVNIVAGFNEETQIYAAPSTASALGTALRKCSLILKCEYITLMDKTKKGLVEDFMVVFDTKFGIYVNKNVAETQIDMQRKKQVILPNVDDISNLISYLTKLRDESFQSLQKTFSIENWKILSESVLIYLMVFNRRRRGEMQFLTVEDFNNRLEIDESDDLYKYLPERGKQASSEYKRLLIRGKKDRPVPVLICQRSLECMLLLKKFRKDAGIHKKNTYFFAVPGKDINRFKSLEACDLLRKYSNLCGAKKPETLRGTALRKHLATTCSLNYSEKRISTVAKFMGHDLKIHKEIYQQPTAATDIVEMSDVLKKAQTPNIGHNSKSLAASPESSASTDDFLPNQNNDRKAKRKASVSDSEIDDFMDELVSNPKKRVKFSNEKKLADSSAVTKSKVRKAKRKASVSDSEIDDIMDELDSNPKKRVKFSNKKKLADSTAVTKSKDLSDEKIKKNRWTQNEVNAVLNAFKHNIEEKTLPSAAEIVELKEQNECLQNRSTATIKSWIHHYNSKTKA
ncbi:uncharacterized protein LOC122503251 [Leptopilina heterotoma]|uniref:uncharacterized protein LOC122503251 n=1 Tax=Leptopilina heterotoma TaxID=63436 RepID=UPI001CA87883|nr:uncharacterized protein LOC122503251 [Leptopilina heterotoma]